MRKGWRNKDGKGMHVGTKEYCSTLISTLVCFELTSCYCCCWLGLFFPFFFFERGWWGNGGLERKVFGLDIYLAGWLPVIE